MLKLLARKRTTMSSLIPEGNQRFVTSRTARDRHVRSRLRQLDFACWAKSIWFEQDFRTWDCKRAYETSGRFPRTLRGPLTAKDICRSQRVMRRAMSCPPCAETG